MTYQNYIDKVESIALGCRGVYYKVMLLWECPEFPQYGDAIITYFGKN